MIKMSMKHDVTRRSSEDPLLLLAKIYLRTACLEGMVCRGSEIEYDGGCMLILLVERSEYLVVSRPLTWLAEHSNPDS